MQIYPRLGRYGLYCITVYVYHLDVKLQRRMSFKHMWRRTNKNDECMMRAMIWLVDEKVSHFQIWKGGIIWRKNQVKFVYRNSWCKRKILQIAQLIIIIDTGNQNLKKRHNYGTKERTEGKESKHTGCRAMQVSGTCKLHYQYHVWFVQPNLDIWSKRIRFNEVNR